MSKLFIHIFYAISIISIAVLLVLNITSIYNYAIYKYDLIKYTGLSAEILMENYKRTIDYVQNPFIKELTYNSVPMSSFGKIHFYEVKRIFIALYVFSIVFIIAMIIHIIRNRNNKLAEKLIKSLNSSVNIMAVIFVSVFAGAVTDFSKAFYLFHKLFFRNDYWIFDPKIDPIINALPEELFEMEFMLIIGVLIIFTIIIKILNYKLKKRKSGFIFKR
ncbi:MULTISPECIES: TIGR01906 family membrane protein [Clostridium]|uniref:TIGR01906 family membrane protein n=1 Tax=Clostridium TaxID=1485 RepID=UPI000985B3ED|nr:TIGR01906 family membrane protein [Clostridium saccharoperbutylacetonicum]